MTENAVLLLGLLFWSAVIGALLVRMAENIHPDQAVRGEAGDQDAQED